MLYNNYEEYMRNVLGHSYRPGNTYEQFNYNYYDRYDYNNCKNCNNISNIEQMYPDLYKIINPVVCDMCTRNNQPITEELIEQMTNNIYDKVVNRIEIQNVINLNIETREMNVGRDAKDKEGNRSSISAPRTRRNRMLQDLIRILILNELRSNRPPFRPGPGPIPGQGPQPMPMPPRPWF